MTEVDDRVLARLIYDAACGVGYEVTEDRFYHYLTRIGWPHYDVKPELIRDALSVKDRIYDRQT